MYRAFLRGIVLHAAAYAIAFAAMAETADEYYQSGFPVVLSATRLAQPQHEAPVAMTVIDRAMIEASGAVDIPELLRLVPGFQIARASGHTITATYHGLSDQHARRMQVRIDGRPVYSPSIGGVRWTDLPVAIEDIERIEVVRGPNAAALGSNSYLGAINITTLHASQTPQISARAQTGNKGFRRGFARYSHSQGTLDYRLSLARRLDDGFQEFVDQDSGARLQRHDSMRTSMVNFRGDHVAANNDAWEFQFGYARGPRGEGMSVHHDPDRTRELTSHYQQLRWHRSESPDDSWTLLAYHNYMDHNEITITPLSSLFGVPPAQVIALFGRDDPIAVDLSVLEQRFGIELQRSLRLHERLRSTWGVGLREDRVKGRVLFNRDHRIESSLQRLFGNLEWRLHDDLVTNLGFTLEHTEFAGTLFSPRLAVNYQFLPRHGMHLSLSRALRHPSILETHADLAVRLSDGTLIDQIMLGNTRIDPERLHAYEVGYLGQFPELRTTVDLKLFHKDIDDRISMVKDKAFPEPMPSPSANLFTNSGRMSINGAELSITWRPAYRTLVGINHNYTRGKGQALNLINGPGVEYEDLGEDIPTHTSSLFAMHRLPGDWDLSLLYYRVTAMKWLGDGDRVPGYDRLDARIKKGFRINGQHGHVAVTCQNLLDEYTDFRQENTFDTRVYFEFGLSLN